ncbi:hypothetical protein Ddc_22131 [Ditylenchus destructor]|nr:hypothetical protein Ddc_22131 [Ditylenchus destructor]
MDAVQLVAQGVGAALHRAGGEVGRAARVGAGVQRHGVGRRVGAGDRQRRAPIQRDRGGQRVDGAAEVQRAARDGAGAGDGGRDLEGVRHRQRVGRHLRGDRGGHQAQTDDQTLDLLARQLVSCDPLFAMDKSSALRLVTCRSRSREVGSGESENGL